MTTTTPTYTVGQRVVVATWCGDAGPGTISRIDGNVAYVVLDEHRDAAAAGTSDAPFAGVIPCMFAEIKPEPTV